MSEKGKAEPLRYNEQICAAFGVSPDTLEPLTAAPGAENVAPERCLTIVPGGHCMLTEGHEGPCAPEVELDEKACLPISASDAENVASGAEVVCRLCGESCSLHSFRPYFGGDLVRDGVRGVFDCPPKAISLSPIELAPVNAEDVALGWTDEWLTILAERAPQIAFAGNKRQFVDSVLADVLDRAREAAPRQASESVCQTGQVAGNVASATSAYDVTQQSNNFGMDQKRTATWLRLMAEKIESGEFILQGCTVLTRAKLDDFGMTFARLQFHEKAKRRGVSDG